MVVAEEPTCAGLERRILARRFTEPSRNCGCRRSPSRRPLHRSRETRAPLALFVLDVDRLKSLNDQYGHVTGAEAVRTAGRVIGQRLPPDAVASRYLGDEFGVACTSFDRSARHEQGRPATLKPVSRCSARQTPRCIRRRQGAAIKSAWPDRMSPTASPLSRLQPTMRGNRRSARFTGSLLQYDARSSVCSS